jgi:hypothetical protein
MIPSSEYVTELCFLLPHQGEYLSRLILEIGKERCLSLKDLIELL